MALQVAGVCEYLQETKKHKLDYKHCQACAKHVNNILWTQTSTLEAEACIKNILDGIQTCTGNLITLQLHERIPEFKCN